MIQRIKKQLYGMILLKIDWEINDPILSDKDKLGKFFKIYFK